MSIGKDCCPVHSCPFRLRKGIINPEVRTASIDWDVPKGCAGGRGSFFMPTQNKAARKGGDEVADLRHGFGFHVAATQQAR